MLEVLSNLHIDLLQDGILFLVIFLSTNLIRAVLRPLSWEARVLGQIFGKLLFLLVIFAAKRSKNAKSYMNYIANELNKIKLKPVKGDTIVLG